MSKTPPLSSRSCTWKGQQVNKVQQSIYEFAESVRVKPEEDNNGPIITQDTNNVFFSEDGSVYKVHRDENGNMSWLILSNILDAVGWYPVDSPFIHSQEGDRKVINIFGDCNVRRYPGTTGQVYKMSDISYATSPTFSSDEYNTTQFVGSGLLESFKGKEWIYLYLKDTMTNSLIAYNYPLVPFYTSYQVAPWHEVPCSDELNPYHYTHAFPNSAPLENLPVFNPTSNERFPTSYEVSGFGDWMDLPSEPLFPQVSNQRQDPFSSWETVENEIDNTTVQSVVDQVLNEGESEMGMFGAPSNQNQVEEELMAAMAERDALMELKQERDYMGDTSSSSDSSSSDSSSSDSSYCPSGSSSSSHTVVDDYWYEEYRNDPFTNEWYSKDEFIDYYGNTCFWDMLSPEKEAKRFMIETIIVRNRPYLSDDNVNHLLNKMIETFM